MCTKAMTGLGAQASRLIQLEPTPRAAGASRRFVSETLAELGHINLVEDAALIASELVTNSLVHAPNFPIWVGVWRTGAFLDLEVWDCSPKPPEYLDPDYLADGGRGLHIVKELGISTGYTIFDCGKAVWALLGLEQSWLPRISLIH
jgi:anti-sigma regulatory factor (Ser/Thr protein kinase)